MAQGKGAAKTSPSRIQTALRRAKALDMRAAGATYEAIAQALGYASKGAACTDVQRALDATVREPADNLRQLELRHLGMLRQRAMDVLTRAHVSVSNGRVVRDEDGKPVTDDMPVLAAVRELRQISESMRKLLGLDAPAKVEVVTDDWLDDEIRRLEASFAS